MNRAILALAAILIAAPALAAELPANVKSAVVRSDKPARSGRDQAIAASHNTKPSVAGPARQENTGAPKR
jgi:hypothetical protein